MTMLARTRFWLFINVYALLMDCVGVAGLVMAILLSRTWSVAAILCGLAAAWILYGGIGIHSTYREKCRIYSVLLKRNTVKLHAESFKDFMAVPCHRMIVRMVLHKLNLDSQYVEIKRMYYIAPWKRRFSSETELFIFKTKVEGDQWLLRQQNKIV